MRESDETAMEESKGGLDIGIGLESEEGTFGEGLIGSGNVESCGRATLGQM